MYTQGSDKQELNKKKRKKNNHINTSIGVF